ncbi:hypothetical protein LCGC14_0822330 [marine sediment metagenome]|uniref:Putative gamma-glutamylcyclotransferase n=1 Tax=marine sediment metagenome TaxID=412755 RepID=A0A0F9SQZ1_9ZZZZ
MTKEDNKNRNQNHRNNYQKFDKLFVYGTLQQGLSRNDILKGLQYKKAILPNHRKVSPPSLGFPFIIRDKSSQVSGEVYFGVEQSIIEEIDNIEREGFLYYRILVKVKINDGNELEAYTYYPSDYLIQNYT